MRVVHLLRKYNPAEWGGTETAIQRLFDGLRQHHVTPITYCPRIENSGGTDPLVEAGFMVKRFNACVPIFGISPQRVRQFIAVGGNLMSFDLPGLLWREKGIDLIHSHVLNRLGSIAAFVARRRKLPLVLTIHGGLLDLPQALRDSLQPPRRDGWEWGKVFGAALRSRRLLHYSDAILTCNQKEAALLQEQHPAMRRDPGSPRPSRPPVRSRTSVRDATGAGRSGSAAPSRGRPSRRRRPGRPRNRR